MRLLTTSNFSPLLLRISASNSVPTSHQPQRGLTDIQYYKSVEYSHLHIWESQSGMLLLLLVVQSCDNLSEISEELFNL